MKSCTCNNCGHQFVLHLRGDDPQCPDCESFSIVRTPTPEPRCCLNCGRCYEVVKKSGCPSCGSQCFKTPTSHPCKCNVYGDDPLGCTAPDCPFKTEVEPYDWGLACCKIAFAEGKTIQLDVAGNGDWRDWKSLVPHDRPTWSTQWKWRVKPEPPKEPDYGALARKEFHSHGSAYGDEGVRAYKWGQAADAAISAYLKFHDIKEK